MHPTDSVTLCLIVHEGGFCCVAHVAQLTSKVRMAVRQLPELLAVRPCRFCMHQQGNPS